MTTRPDRLRAFLERFEGKPVVWGVDDCSAAPALWRAEETGVAVRLPVYSSRDEAHAIIAARGGLDQVWAEIAAEAGAFERYGDPEVGDTAIIDTRKYGLIGGICGAGRILIIRKDEGGWHPFGPVRQFAKVYATP